MQPGHPKAMKPLQQLQISFTPDSQSQSDGLCFSIPEDDGSVDSNYDPEASTILSGAGTKDLSLPNEPNESSSSVNNYDADTIRAEFRAYQSILPHPDALLQQQQSFQLIRAEIERNGVEVPRWLKYKFEGGIKPHHALCCLLLSEYQEKQEEQNAKGGEACVGPSLVEVLSFGLLHRQVNNPAEFIRNQFNRVAHVVPTDMVKAPELRKKIKNRGLPVPNYFLDPEDEKQFPPHIALLVILQDGEEESRKFGSILYELAFSLFALVALLLRMVLEVIGGAGAIWGGAEVFGLRDAGNTEPWRWMSVAIGVLCLLRFVTLNAPQREDEGDILGPAGPWSLRLPVRLRAVCAHPFHYFVRALPLSSPLEHQKKGRRVSSNQSYQHVNGYGSVKE